MADIRKPGQVSRATPPTTTPKPEQAAAQRYTVQANRATTAPKTPRIAPATSNDIRNLPGLQNSVARFGYWDNPLRVVRYRNAMQTLPPEQRQNIPIDEQRLEGAFTRLKEYNAGRPVERWIAPPDQDEYYTYTRAMSEPPQEMKPYYEWQRATKENPNPWKQAGMGDLYPMPRAEAEGYFTSLDGLQTQGDNVLVPASWLYADQTPQQDMTNGIPTETYDRLKPWQKFLLNASPAGSGAAMGGGQGAIMGLLAGGPVGAAVGGAMGGGLGWLFGTASGNETAQKAISLLNVLDVPAEGVERVLGLASQIIDSTFDPAQFGPVKDILDNLPQAWQAAHFTENVSFLPVTANGELSAWEVTNPEPTLTKIEGTGAVSSIMLAEARKRLIQGESIEAIEADFRNRIGVQYDINEAIGHMVLDPLNIIALGENALIKAGARLAKNAPLLKSVETIEALNRTRNIFNKAGAIDVAGEYARNLRLLKPAELEKFGALSRWVAGVDEAGQVIDYATQPRAKAAIAKSAQQLFGLTPQSKANTMTRQLAQGLDVAIHDAGSVREIEHVVNSVANLKPGDAVRGLEDAGMMQWFESAEAQPAPQAVKNAMPRVEAVLTAYKSVLDAPGQPGAITQLQQLADAASTEAKRVTINDVIRAFGEAENKQDFERIYRGYAETIQANITAGTLDPKILQGVLEGGYGKYAEMARLFYGPDGIPFTLPQLKARVSAALAQGIEEFTVKYFNVKRTGWAERASNAVKGFQTLTMLNTPTFVANNYINNMLTMAWDGLIGVSSRRGRTNWIKGLGFDPETFRTGMTAADLGRVGSDIDTAKKPGYQMGEVIRKAVNGNRSKFEHTLAEFANRAAIFPRLGGYIERSASEQAYYHAMRPYWDAIWTGGKGFDRMSKEYKTLAGYLDSLAPGTSKRIEQMIAKSKSRAEIEAAVFNGFQTSALKDVLPAEDLEVLNVVPGLVDDIDKGLADVQTPEDVRRVMNTAREKVIKQIRTETRKQARAKAEAILTRMNVEGVPGGIAAFDEVIDARSTALMQHFDRMQTVADDIEARLLMGKERAAVWQKARAEEDQIFRAFEDDEAAKWLGMYQALGSTDEDAARLLALLGEGNKDTGTMGLHSNWRRFFTQTAEEHANFNALPDDMPKAEKAKAWDEMNTRLLDEYNAAVLEEDRIMDGIDTLTARLYGRGKDAIAERDMLNWRVSQREVRRKMAAVQSFFRGGKVPAGMEGWADEATIAKVRALTKGRALHLIGYNDRAEINTKFYNDIYRPLIAEQAQVGHATQPKAPKPQPAPVVPQPKPRAPKATQPAAVETPAQPAPRVDQSALWKRIAETKPDMVGVLSDGTFDGAAKLEAIKFMRKNNPGAGVKRFNDITPEAWDQAVKNESLRTKAQQPLEATQYPPVERRVQGNELLRQFIDEFMPEARKLGLTDEQIRKALPNLIRDRETKALTYTVYEATYNTLRDQGITPQVAGMDLRGLHMTNKNFGDAVGNAYIAQVQRVADEMGLTFLSRRREGGDEFIAIGADPTKLQAQMQELSDRFERSIIVVDGKEYDGLKLHFGIATGPDAERAAGAAIDASTAARNADADWNARAGAGREYSLSPRDRAAEGVDVREAQPTGIDGPTDAGPVETGAAERAAAAATDGELKPAEDLGDIDETEIQDIPDQLVLVNNESGEVLDPRDVESAGPAVPTPVDTGNVTPEMRAFVRGASHPFKQDEIATARVYLSELGQSKTTKIITPEGEYSRVWENAPVWYKGMYESLKADDVAFNQANAGAIRRDKYKPRNTKRVVKSRKAGQMHGYVKKALDYIILDRKAPRDAPELDKWIGWVRSNIAYSMTNPQENFNPSFAWWVGEKDIVLETLDEQIKTILSDPNATEDSVIAALGQYGNEIIDEYMVRQSAQNFPDVLDEATPPASALDDTAIGIADNIDEAETLIDIEDRFTRGKQEFEQAVMEANPEDGDTVIEIMDNLARNFNPEIDSEAFYNRLGWRFGGEFAGEEGLQRAAPDSPEFRAWFGDSKVVDAEGKPLVVYHGTPRGGFDRFDRDKLGSLTKSPDAFEGFYFAENPKDTEPYATGLTYNWEEKEGITPGIMPVYLSIKNPRVYSAEELHWNLLLKREDLQAAKSAGYDGIIREGPSGKEYIVFSPEQIKSTFNRGTFDPANPNILLRNLGNVDGLTTFTESGRALMRVYSATDPTAAAHELIHGITPMMRQADADLVRNDPLMSGLDLPEDWHTQMQYTQDASQMTPVHTEAFERLSRAFERYLAEGRAPSTGLERLFSRMKSWMLKVYRQIAGSKIDVPLSDETRAMFDRWMGGEPEPKPIVYGSFLRAQGEPRIEITSENSAVWMDRYREMSWGYADTLYNEQDPRNAGGRDRLRAAAWNRYDQLVEMGDALRKAGHQAAEPNKPEFPRPGKQEPPRAEPEPTPAPEPTPSLWDRGPAQAGLFQSGEDLPLFSQTPQRAQAETFAPKPENQQPAMFDMREQLPTIEARQATGGAEGTPLFEGQKQPWQMTRTEFMTNENTPKVEAIKRALSQGKKVTVSTQYRVIPLSSPDHVRITKTGEVQIPEGRKWVYLTSGQIDSLSRQAGYTTPELENRVFHRAEVETAISEGKPVPAEVLADYPDLKPAQAMEKQQQPIGTPRNEMSSVPGSVADLRLLDYEPGTSSHAIAANMVRAAILPRLEKALGSSTSDFMRNGLMNTVRDNVVEDLNSGMLPDLEKQIRDKVQAEELRLDAIRQKENPAQAMEQTQGAAVAEQMTSRAGGITYSDVIIPRDGVTYENIVKELDNRLGLFEFKIDGGGFVRARWVVSHKAGTIQKRLKVYLERADGSWRMFEEPTPDAKVLVKTDTGKQSANLLFRDNGPVLPIGTVDQMSAPPTDSAMLEMLRDRIMPMLDKAETQLANDAGSGNKLFEFGKIDPEYQKQLRAYLGKVGGQMGDAKLATMRYGKARRDFALLPYERRYNFDTYLQGIMPYEFWYTRSMMNWMIRAANKPQIIANYMRLQQFFNEQQQRGGFPTRLKKKSFIRLPFLPEWMGEGVYFDPYKQAFPFLQLTGPFERMYSQENQARQRAITLLQQQVEDGTLDATEAQTAIQGQAGLTWQEALAQAKNEIDADVQNPLDFARMISGFSLPMNIAYLYAMGRQDEISQLPTTRLIQNVTAPLGIGGARGWNMEAGIRNAAGLPEVDRFEDYRVDRMLASMAAMGEISADDAQRAMIDREGEAFTRAQRKVSQMGFFQYIGAPLAVDFFPEGEQKQRQLRDVYNTAYNKYKAGDKTALSKFFDKYPEYQARMSSFQEPEERLKRFLISEVWERYNAMPALYKRQAREQLGDTFNDAFLSSETRSYDSITAQTLATWARSLGDGSLPNSTPDTPQIGLKFAEPEVAQGVEDYNAEADRLFPGIGQFLASFYQMPQEQQDAARAQYPQIQAYYSWKNKYLAEHQNIIPWVTSEKSELFGLPQDLQAGVYSYRAERDQLFPGIDAIQEGYFNAADQKAYGKQNPQLYEYWDWRKAKAAQNPKIAPYILSDEALAKAILEPNPTNTLTQDQVSQISDTTVRHLYAYFYNKETLRTGPMTELSDLWESWGEPYGSLKKWIDTEVRATFTGNTR